jgi:alkylation response protein AidB-like acyl-CoA dehydrogenase
MSDLDFPRFSEEDLMLKETVRRFTAEKLRPLLDTMPDSAIGKPNLLRLLQMMKPFGILGARIPEKHGGDELTFVQLGILYETLPAEAAMIASTNALNASRILNGGSPELCQRYLPGLLSGEIIAASAISEPNAGSDISSMRTRAELDGDHYVINGQKVWSSAGDAADVLVVAVSCGKDARGRAIIGRLLVDKREARVTTRALPMLGLKRHGMAEVIFEDCIVPKGNMIGVPGDGEQALALSWLSHRVCIGLIALNIAQEALTKSLDYAKLRVQFGRAIGASQLIQSKLVDMSIAVETSRYLCYRALYQLDQGVQSRYASSVAKLQATETAVKVTSEAIQIHGASGLSTELGLEKLHRDARMLTIPDGTSEIQRLIAGRELLGINAIRG